MSIIIPFIFGGFAAVFATMCSILCWKNRLGAAVVAASVATVAVILGYFPMLTSLDAFSVHVKMQENLGKSEAILQAMQDLSVASAKSTLFSMATSSTEQVEGAVINVPISRRQQKIIDDVMARLKNLALKEDQKNEILEPLLNYVDFQLSGVFDATISKMVGRSSASQENQKRTLATIEAIKFEIGSAGGEASLNQYMNKIMAVANLSPESSNALRTLQQKIIRLHNQMANEFTYSDELRDLFERNYNGFADREIIP